MKTVELNESSPVYTYIHTHSSRLFQTIVHRIKKKSKTHLYQQSIEQSCYKRHYMTDETKYENYER